MQVEREFEGDSQGGRGSCSSLQLYRWNNELSRSPLNQAAWITSNACETEGKYSVLSHKAGEASSMYSHPGRR